MEFSQDETHRVRRWLKSVRSPIEVVSHAEVTLSVVGERIVMILMHVSQPSDGRVVFVC